VRRLLAALLFLSASACAFTAEQTPEALRALPAGQYQLEKPHASLTFSVTHLGLSRYTLRFADLDASLDFDPANPAASRVSASINPLSVRSDHPTDAGWDGRIGADILQGGRFPQITFTSTAVEPTGPFTGRVTGDLTLMGVTKPVALDVTYNGSMASAALYSGRAAVGFSASGRFKRSDFGSTRYAEFVGDEVEVSVQAEFTRR
jgi:polyisoprenoid-binding protein YceI